MPIWPSLLAEEFLIVDVATGSVHPRAAFLAVFSAHGTPIVDESRP